MSLSFVYFHPSQRIGPSLSLRKVPMESKTSTRKGNGKRITEAKADLGQKHQ